MQPGQVLQVLHRLIIVQRALKANVKGDLETGIVTTCGAPHSPAAWYLRFSKNRSQGPLWMSPNENVRICLLFQDSSRGCGCFCLIVGNKVGPDVQLLFRFTHMQGVDQLNGLPSPVASVAEQPNVET